MRSTYTHTQSACVGKGKSYATATMSKRRAQHARGKQSVQELDSILAHHLLSTYLLYVASFSGFSGFVEKNTGGRCYMQ